MEFRVLPYQRGLYKVRWSSIKAVGNVHSRTTKFWGGLEMVPALSHKQDDVGSNPTPETFFLLGLKREGGVTLIKTR